MAEIVVAQEEERKGPSLPVSSAEKSNMIIHYYRGEMGRMTSWRDRIDRTTNWAITMVAGLLSVSLSTPTSHHGLVLFAMVVVTLLLHIEARRYRFFDVYRARVRQLERHYFAQALDPLAELNLKWARSIAVSLRNPVFHMSYREALFRRIRRNYGWMYAILILAWGLKISTPRLQPDETRAVYSIHDMLRNADLGPFPGWIVVTAVLCFYACVLFAATRRRPDDDDFVRGEAHM